MRWPVRRGCAYKRRLRAPHHHHTTQSSLNSYSLLSFACSVPAALLVRQQLAMAQGRGSARVVLAVVLLCVLLHGEFAESAMYTVGWTPSPGGLPGGKRFRAGDALLFKYGRGAHNVVAVDAAGYRSCRAPRGARTYSSGNDRVTLSRGANYFICSVGNHCANGMKMQVNAA